MKKILEKENVVLLFSTLVLGVIVGISSLLLSLFLDGVERVFLSFQESASHPAALAVTPMHRAISVFIGSIIVAIIWWKIRPADRPTTTINQALAGKKMAPFQTIQHVINQIFYVGTGGSVGRELAPREAGSMFAQVWTGFLNKWHINLSAEDKKLLIAAAAGAGFAGVYSAPLTGMLFCVEILLKKVTKKTVVVSLIMSSIAMVIGTIVKGFGPYYIVGKQHFSIIFLIAVIFIAPLCGYMGAIFRKTFKWAEKNQTRDKKILWQLPLAGLLTGIVAAFFPQIMGNGRALAQLSIDTVSYKILWLILLGAFLKAIITVVTIKNGAAGGTLTPSISIGAVLGIAIGFILHLFFTSIPIRQFAILGACSLLAASQQAPLMALMMIIEICHLNYSAILPLGLGVSLAIIVSKMVLKDVKV